MSPTGSNGCWRLSICSAVLSSFLLACQTPVPAGFEPVQRSQPLLGTFVTITVFEPDRDKAQQAISAAFDEFRRVDRLLSIHKAESETARLNAEAAQTPVRVPTELFRVIQTSLQIAERTSGAFDPAIGPLAQLWGFIWKDYRLPTAEELARVLPLVNYRNVILHEDQTVSFRASGMFLDFGGLGKGYAVDRAIGVLKEFGIRSAMVKAGGDLRVLGLPPGARAWEVQLEDPARKGQRTVVHLEAGALSTSGNYENYFEVDGQRYSHIVNPRTGLPVQGIASCTVTAPTCVESDAYATAFFVLGIRSTLERFGSEFGIRFVDTELRVYDSPEFKSRLRGGPD